MFVAPSFYFILFLISNENIIKLSKKSVTQVYNKNTLGTSNQTHDLQASIKEWTKKNWMTAYYWQPIQ